MDRRVSTERRGTADGIWWNAAGFDNGNYQRLLRFHETDYSTGIIFPPLFSFELPKADNGYLQHIDELKNNNRVRAFPMLVSGNGIIGLMQRLSLQWWARKLQVGIEAH